MNEDKLAKIIWIIWIAIFIIAFICLYIKLASGAMKIPCEDYTNLTNKEINCTLYYNITLMDFEECDSHFDPVIQTLNSNIQHLNTKNKTFKKWNWIFLITFIIFAIKELYVRITWREKNEL